MIKTPEKRIMKVSELRPADYNPRKISREAKKGLRRSMSEFGLLQPIIFNERTGNIVGGHQRYAVLIEEKIDETEVVIVDLPPEKEVTLNVALNNPEIQGEWDDTIMNVLESIEAETPELFAALRIDDLKEKLSHMGDDDEDSVDDDLPAVPTKAVSKKGDIWLLGSHILLCGDGSKRKDVEELIRKRKANLLITSPDFKMDTEDDEGKVEEKVGSAVEASLSAMKDDDSRIIINCCNLRPTTSYTRLFLLADKWVRYYLEEGWKLRNVRHWGRDVNKFKSPQEDIFDSEMQQFLMFYKEGADNRGQNVLPDKWAARVDWDIEWESDKEGIPVEVPRRLILLYSNEGELIFNPFAGTGSVIIAAEKTNRKCCAMEGSPIGCDRIVQRWQRFTSKIAKTTTGKTLESEEEDEFAGLESDL